MVDRNSYAEQMHELGAAESAEAKRRGLGVVKLNHEDLTPGSKITILCYFDCSKGSKVDSMTRTMTELSKSIVAVIL